MTHTDAPAATTRPLGSAWSKRPDDAPVTDALLDRVDAWWRAANYLSVGQIYLLDNPLLRRPLERDDIKPRLLGHWGTAPGLNLSYAHLNRVIAEREQPTLFIAGPGHGGPAMLANAYLDGTYSEIYPDIDQTDRGLQRLFRQFSFPGGVPSHAAPETPGSIHEGGELGYVLSHAYGAAFDNPDLLVAAIVGDGEAETGPLATSWHSNKFVNPLQDGVVLPILHLNGFKIANPTVLARIPEAELADLMRGYGHEPFFVEGGFDGEDPMLVHRRLADTLDIVLDRIADIKARAAAGDTSRPTWPMIVLRTPKGWTCPETIDGTRVEGTFHSHQVPLANARDTEEHTRILESWMRRYRPEELFGESGAVHDDIRSFAPTGELRMSATPHANGGLLRTDLDLPSIRDAAVVVDSPGGADASATGVLGEWLTEVIRRNPETFRIFAPDELASNRLQAVFDATDRQWDAETTALDEHLARAGRVMEVLSEHQCQGWLEGYLLTGRHGVFTCYEAFIHIIDSMFNQHAKWLNGSRALPWRRPIASLNYLLTSHVWRQDHNGFSHQDPGFIDHVVNKKPDVIRVYLPFDANTLLSVYDHCLRSRDEINVVVAGKNEEPSWLGIEDAADHCARGLGILPFAGSERAGEAPDLVMACAGDIPTLETLAAVDILRNRIPELSIRVVNVVDLMRLMSEDQHPHGLSDAEYDSLFTTDKPVVFAYHGYPWLIHRLTYKRAGHDQLHVRGYLENGTTTTPFDMVMLNLIDRYSLVCDAIDRTPGLGERHADLRQEMQDARHRARAYTREHGEDAPEVTGWRWPVRR
ncbi:MAG TPA: phosphoketolase family protein [Plantibacter sp.]|uniref:phosphoketolase family protein n=1 Tax=Plantibacter sp. TaxID=1871045 RepID=UPI002CFFC79F|nr:phosphoketolase family protein [Plantibacter sp.]